jgi:hypothetical protein
MKTLMIFCASESFFWIRKSLISNKKKPSKNTDRIIYPLYSNSNEIEINDYLITFPIK